MEAICAADISLCSFANDCASGKAARTFGGASSPVVLLVVLPGAEVVLAGAELDAVVGVVVLLVSLELEHAAAKPASELARTSVMIFFMSVNPSCFVWLVSWNCFLCYWLGRTPRRAQLFGYSISRLGS